MQNTFKRKVSMATAINNISSKSVLDKQQYKSAAEAGYFDGKLSDYVNELTSGSRKGKDLTAAITEIAKRDSLSSDEIDRVCQAANMKVYQEMFDKTVGKADRSVKFEIAKPEVVKEGLGLNPSSPENVELSGGSEEKVASEGGIVGAILRYDGAGRERIYSKPVLKGTHAEYLFNKIAADINADIEKAAGIRKEIDHGITSLGLCFCKYAGSARKIDIQHVFEKLSYEAGMGRQVQLRVKDRFEDMRGHYKIASNIGLELVDIDAVEDYSLGRHSISKIADDGVATLPEVVDKKRNIRDFERLVQVAMKIQEDDKLLEEINNNIDAKRNIVDANEEMLVDEAQTNELEEV